MHPLHPPPTFAPEHALNVGFQTPRDLFNKQFSSHPKLLFQIETNCEAIDLKKPSYYPANKTDFNKKGFHLALF